MARILVTGAGGLLGINVTQETMGLHDLIAIDRSKLINPPFHVIALDLLAPGAVEYMLDAAQPDWLINCAALADLEACEKDPDLAYRLNAELPARLAAACAVRGVSWVHVSTDAVFDGESPDPYTEEHYPNPLSVYARTKLQGEQSVLLHDPSAIVARVNFYGWSLSGARSLAEFFFNNLSAGRQVGGFTDVHFSPMLVNHTVRLMLKMLAKGLRGLYHLVGTQPMSKYHFGIQLARKFNLDEGLILPKSVHDSSLVARRANNLILSTKKLSTDLQEDLPVFSTGMDEFHAQFQQSYPQRIRSYAQKKQI